MTVPRTPARVRGHLRLHKSLARGEWEHHTHTLTYPHCISVYYYVLRRANDPRESWRRGIAPIAGGELANMVLRSDHP